MVEVNDPFNRRILKPKCRVFFKNGVTKIDIRSGIDTCRNKKKFIDKPHIEKRNISLESTASEGGLFVECCIVK